MDEPATYRDNHPGTSLDHLRAAVAHLTRALGLAMDEGRDKECRVATRAAREMAHEAIEALTRQAREAAGGPAEVPVGLCAFCLRVTPTNPADRDDTVCPECREGLMGEAAAQRAEDLAEWFATGRVL